MWVLVLVLMDSVGADDGDGVGNVVYGVVVEVVDAGWVVLCVVGAGVADVVVGGVCCGCRCSRVVALLL